MSIQSITQPLPQTNNNQFQSSTPSLRVSSQEYQMPTIPNSPKNSPAQAQHVHSNNPQNSQIKQTNPTNQQTIPQQPNTQTRPVKVGHIVWAHLDNHVDHPYWPCKVYRINRQHYLVQYYGVAEKDKWCWVSQVYRFEQMHTDEFLNAITRNANEKLLKCLKQAIIAAEEDIQRRREKVSQVEIEKKSYAFNTHHHERIQDPLKKIFSRSYWNMLGETKGEFDNFTRKYNSGMRRERASKAKMTQFLEQTQ